MLSYCTSLQGDDLSYKHCHTSLGEHVDPVCVTLLIICNEQCYTMSQLKCVTFCVCVSFLVNLAVVAKSSHKRLILYKFSATENNFGCFYILILGVRRVCIYGQQYFV